MKNKIIIAAIVFVLLLIIIGCISVSNNDSNGSDDTTTETGPIEFFKTDEDTFNIKTPYCDLKYPKVWKDKVKTESFETDESYSVKFTADLGNEGLPLYTFVFGTSSEGSKLGTLKAKKGTVDVYIVYQNDGTADGYVGEELDNYYQMCEDINVIISKLVYDSGLELTK